MKKTYWLAASIALAVVGACFLVVLAAGLWSKRDALPSGNVSRIFATDGALTKRVSYYGETISATFTVVVNRSFIDSETVSPQTNFKPYRVVEVSVTKEGNSQATFLHFRYMLQCLEIECLPNLATRPLLFRPTPIYYRVRNGNIPARLLVRWPVVNIASNLSEVDIDLLKKYLKAEDQSKALSPFWTNDDLPSPSYRWGGRFLVWGTLTLCGALALLSLGLALLSRRFWRDANAITLARASGRDAFLQALDIAQSLLDGTGVPGNDRARALGLLAERCRMLGWSEEASELDVFAWSLEAASSADDLTCLTSIVKKLRNSAAEPSLGA